jgi:hypothetical protein
MPDLAESEFLTGGIAHYLEAQQAIHAFNEAMLERLDRYRRGRSWGLLQDVGFERNQVAGGPENGWWISTGVRGRTARFPTVRIDFGMWFGIPERPEPILYIGFFEEPKELLALKARNDLPGVESFERWGLTFLCTPLSVAFEPDMDRLIEALLRELR